MPKRQVLEDEISADLEGRAERSRKSGEDLEHQPSLPAITAGCQRLPWADGVLANHTFLDSRDLESNVLASSRCAPSSVAPRVVLERNPVYDRDICHIAHNWRIGENVRVLLRHGSVNEPGSTH